MEKCKPGASAKTLSVWAPFLQAVMSPVPVGMPDSAAGSGRPPCRRTSLSTMKEPPKRNSLEAEPAKQAADSARREDGARRDAAEFVGSSGAKKPILEGPGLYGLLVESVQDYAIFALDPDGYILSWNAGA